MMIATRFSLRKKIILDFSNYSVFQNTVKRQASFFVRIKSKFNLVYLRKCIKNGRFLRYWIIAIFLYFLFNSVVNLFVGLILNEMLYQESANAKRQMP